jgi:hypothetical protein
MDEVEMNDEDKHAIEDWLRAQRPVPSAGFRGTLRRRLLAGAGRPAPGRLRLLITAYAGSGTLLLAIAALGLTGTGPLAPG